MLRIENVLRIAKSINVKYVPFTRGYFSFSIFCLGGFSFYRGI